MAFDVDDIGKRPKLSMVKTVEGFRNKLWELQKAGPKAMYLYLSDLRNVLIDLEDFPAKASSEEIAAVVGYDSDAVNNWARKGVIRAEKVGSKWRLDVYQIYGYFNKQYQALLKYAPLICDEKESGEKC